MASDKKNKIHTFFETIFDELLILTEWLGKQFQFLVPSKKDRDEKDDCGEMVPEVDPELINEKIDLLKNSFESRKQARALRQARLADEEKEMRERQSELSQMMLSLETDEDDEAESSGQPTTANAIEIGETIIPKPIVELAETKDVEQESSKSLKEKMYNLTSEYRLPGLELLEDIDESAQMDDEELKYQSEILQNTLDSFAIDAQVIGATVGPRVTLYKVQPASGVKVESITQISNNIAMEMCALSLRILTPVPGRKFVGIEVPNRKSALIGVKSMLQSPEWLSDRNSIPLVLGKNIAGENVTLDLAKAPHLLIAGATGSGKSVCLNTMILSMLYRFSPEEMRLILVDPKVVEFSVYKNIPHLVVPIITESDKVQASLNWVIKEMEERYQLLSKVGARNIASFNSRHCPDEGEMVDGNWIPRKLPFLVVVIDELADVMMTARADVEVSLARIAQLSRAVGIHMIIATQRPSVNVITGIIKANFPTRIAFQVTSQIDSRTILDSKGAEALLGRGDMLYSPPGASGLQRIQGPLITDKEVELISEFTAAQADQVFNFEVFETANAAKQSESGGDTDISEKDEELIRQAIEIIMRDGRASTSYIQRSLRIGYNRAAFIMDVLEERSIVGPQIGSAPREILIENEF